MKKIFLAIVLCLMLCACSKKDKQETNLFEVGNIGTVRISNGGTPITSKEDYVDSSITMSDPDYTLEKTSVKVRLRGNSSLGSYKKSYKLKFDSKVDVFGMGENKEWALISNTFDPSHVRNFLAYRLALTMGLEYSVECRYVQLYLNSEHQGLYLLCETVKTGSNRVNIETDYTNTDTEIPFLLELDFKMVQETDPEYFGTEDVDFFYIDNTEYNYKKYPIATKYPKEYTDITEEQYSYIKNYMFDTYDSVRNGNYEDYIDVDSCLDYFILQELFYNVDLDYSSVFFYKPVGEKLKFGPAWDFDISSGNCNYNNMLNYEKPMKDINKGSYIFNTLMEDKSFHKKFKTRIKEWNKAVNTMIDSLDDIYEDLQAVVKIDTSLWSSYPLPGFHPVPYYLKNITYKEQIDYLVNFFTIHYNWMKKEM